MKKYVLICIILLFQPGQIHSAVDYPWVPRATAYEAYSKYRMGKAIIFHAGGVVYQERHIMGALNLDIKDREPILRKYPKEGIEYFTYCY